MEYLGDINRASLIVSERQKDNFIAKQVKGERYRFVNLTVYLLAALINSFPTQTLAGISPIVKDIYGISAVTANLNSFIFPIAYVCFWGPVSYVANRYGLKVSTLICQFCMILGLSVRLLINIDFVFFLVGTVICSFGFAFMLTTANNFANSWFPSNQITLVNSACILALFTSDALGLFIPTIFIDKSSSKETVLDFLQTESAVLIVVHATAALLFRGRPAQPANFASTAKHRHLSYRNNMLGLIRHQGYLRLFAVMTLIFTVVTVMLVSLPWMTDWAFNQVEAAGIVVAMANGAGIIGCLACEMLFKQRYRLKCLVLLFGALISFIVLSIGIDAKMMPLLYVSGFLFGLNFYPLLANLTDFASQSVYPLSETTSSGTLLFGGQLLGFVCSLVFSFGLSEDIRGFNFFLTLQIVQVILLGLAFLLMLTVKEKLNREEYETEERNKNQSLIKTQEAISRDSLLTENDI